MAEHLKMVKGPNTSVDVISLDGPGSALNNLEYRTFEALITGNNVRMSRYAAENNYDAVVMGCFYDTGLEDMREISGDTIVVAPCQASLQITANLANRFSVLVGNDKWIEQMSGNVRKYGYGERLASMRSIATSANELQADTCYTVKRFIEAGRKAIEEDRAEAIILGCTCSFGLHHELQKALGVPVIDPLYAPLKMAELLATTKHQFGWTPSRIGSCAPPEEELLKQFGVFNDPAPIGNCIAV